MLTGDKLLAVLSARRSLSSRAWRNAFDVLHGSAVETGDAIDEPIQFVRHRTLRGLFELAHCDFDDTIPERICFAAPSILAMLPLAGVPRAVVCGSRGPTMIDVLKAARSAFRRDAQLSVVRPAFSGGYLPSTIVIEATSNGILAAIAERSGILFLERPPAWSILSAASPLQEYEATLNWHNETDPGWPRKDFSTRSLTFTQPHQTTDPERLSIYEDPRTSRVICRIRCGETSAAVDRTWGRWLLLARQSTNVLSYDESSQRLKIPTTVPLPRILARSLTLFSGTPPARSSAAKQGLAYEVYSAIPSECAQVLAAKLAQVLAFERPSVSSRG